MWKPFRVLLSKQNIVKSGNGFTRGIDRLGQVVIMFAALLSFHEFEAVVVAQLVERSLPTPEVGGHRQKSVLNIYCQLH